VEAPAVTLILPSDVDGLTETDVANFLIAAVVTHGGRLHTALTVAGLFLADDAIRARFHPEDVAAEEAARRRRADREAERDRRRHEGAAKGAATRRARRARP
jgi:hypothetical protein